MKEYLRILENVKNGEPKQPTRDQNGKAVNVENATIGRFMEIFRHNMSEGFPLLTTKKMGLKNICVELEGFIHGITDKRWYEERNCYIWSDWCNPTEVPENLTGEERKEFMKEEPDLGPIYGSQWRDFNAGFSPDYTPELTGGTDSPDQFDTIIQKLHTRPYDRRMVCSAWNPLVMYAQALPPCHYAWNVVVYGNKLNLTFHLRSNDVFLGLPYNIASYAMLQLLLCKESGFEPGELVGTMSDCHLYTNHIEQAEEQLSRTPFDLPTVIIPDETWNGIYEWEHDQFVLEGYQCHDRIKAEITV